MQVTNDPTANTCVRCPYRDGWTLQSGTKTGSMRFPLCGYRPESATGLRTPGPKI